MPEMKNNFGLSVNISPQNSLKESRAPIIVFYINVLAIILGLHYFCWNVGLNSGFWELLGSLFIFWSAFLCQALSLAEMTGSLPFTGGSYALVRVTLGPWFGFLTGMLEISQSVLAFALGIWCLSDIVNSNFNMGNNNIQLQVCLPFLFVLVGLNIWYTYFPQLWIGIFVSAVIVIIIWSIFLIGASQQVDFLEYENKSHEKHSIFAVTDSISVSVWFFICLSAIPCIAKNVHMPKQEFPKLFITASVFILVFAVISIYIVSGQRPGGMALSFEKLPLTSAYYNLFHASLPSRRHAAWLSFPAIFYTSFLLLRVTCQRLQSMCASGLIPHIAKLLNRTQRIILGSLKAKSLPVVFTSLSSSSLVFRLAHEQKSPPKEIVENESSKQHSITKGSSHVTKKCTNNHASSVPTPAPMLSAPLVASSPALFHHQKKGNKENNSYYLTSSSTSVTTPSGTSPVMINIFIGIVTLAVCVLLRFQNLSTVLMFAIYCTLCASIAIMLAYVYFRKKFDCLETTFRSPVHIYGSIFGGSIFALAIVYMVIKQSHDLRIVISMIMYLALLTVYYFYAARRSQCFSEEEQRVMFVAYVINANIKSKLRRQSSMAALKRENSLGSALQRTPSFFRENNKSPSRSISINSLTSTLNCRTVRYKFPSAESTNRSVSVTNGHIQNSNSSIEDGSFHNNKRFIKFPHPRPVSTVSSSVIGVSTVGIAVSENELPEANSPKVAGGNTINYNSNTDTVGTQMSQYTAHSQIPLHTEEFSHRSGKIMYVKEDIASNKALTEGSPIVLRMSLSIPSQSDLLLMAPNSSKKDPFAQTVSDAPLPFLQIHQPTVHQLSVSTMQLTQPQSPSTFSPEHSLPTAVTEEEYTPSNNQSIVFSHSNLTNSTHSINEIPPQNPSRKASFINWMISSISKTRIYTIPDDEENSVSFRSKHSNNNHNHSSSNMINNSSNNSNSNSNISSVLNSFCSRKSNISSPKHTEDNKLTDSAVNAAVQDRLRELGQHNAAGTISSKDRFDFHVQSFSTGSFSVPTPTKIYRPSLGEVVTVVRRQSSNSEKISSKVHLEPPLSACKDGPDDMRILDVEASLPVSRKNSAESDAPVVLGHGNNSSMNNSDNNLYNNNNSINHNANNNHVNISINSRVSLKRSFVGSSKRMTVLPFFSVKTNEVQQIHQDDNHYRENNEHYLTSSSNATCNQSMNVIEPARRRKRTSILAAKGMLRRSINQLSSLAHHVLPIVDDQKEFDEYTKLFVQAMLNDMETHPNNSCNNNNDYNNDNDVNNERVGQNDPTTIQDHFDRLLDV